MLELSELALLNLEKRQYLPHYWSDEGFKDTGESGIAIF